MISLIACLASLGCSDWNADRVPHRGSEERDYKATTGSVDMRRRNIELLLSCQDWTKFSGENDNSARVELINVLTKLMKLDPGEAKLTLKEFSTHRQQNESSDRYHGIQVIFNRMYFAVDSQSDRKASLNPFFGIGGIHSTLWPLEMVQGRLVLVGTVRGCGPTPYLFDAEFDAFSKAFGRRKW